LLWRVDDQRCQNSESNKNPSRNGLGLTIMTPKKPHPTLLIRLYGSGVLPERVPVGIMSEVISNVQTLASGDDEKYPLHLMGIQRKSAGYQCVADSPDLVLKNLEISGKAAVIPDTLQFHMIGAFEELSRIAARLDCTIEISAGAKKLLEVTSETIKKVRSVLITDEASINGKLVRVGGATENRCAVRMPDRKKLLYCKVASTELGQLLGKHLYEDVTLTGNGTFFARTWQVLNLVVTQVAVKKPKRSFDSFYRFE
jgi:hypothetical protein